MKIATGTSTAIETTSRSSIAARQPIVTVSEAIAGMKMSCPVDVAAPNAPRISPRCERTSGARRWPEDVPDGARPDADDDAPEREELPEIPQRQHRVEAGRDERAAEQDHLPRSETADERAGQRSAEPEGEDAHRDGR